MKQGTRITGTYSLVSVQDSTTKTSIIQFLNQSSPFKGFPKSACALSLYSLSPNLARFPRSSPCQSMITSSLDLRGRDSWVVCQWALDWAWPMEGEGVKLVLHLQNVNVMIHELHVNRSFASQRVSNHDVCYKSSGQKKYIFLSIFSISGINYDQYYESLI